MVSHEFDSAGYRNRKKAKSLDSLLEDLQEFTLHTFFDLDPSDPGDGLFSVAFGICDFLYDAGKEHLIPESLHYVPSYQRAQEYAELYGYQEFPRYLEVLGEALDALSTDKD